MRMPRANRSDSPNRLSRLVFELLYSPSLDRPLDSFTFCDRDDVYVASLLEDLGDLQVLSQNLLAKLQLILYRSSIDLNFKEIRRLPADRRGSGSAGDYGSDSSNFSGVLIIRWRSLSWSFDQISPSVRSPAFEAA